MDRYINGQIIDTIRRNMELTVEQYAELCQIPRGTMRHICEGRNRPNGEHLLKIIVYGGVSPRALRIDGWEVRS